jgi:hypothetical protein
MMLDILWRELKIWDEIVFTSQWTTELKRRRVIEISDKFWRWEVKVLKEDSWKTWKTTFRWWFLIINDLLWKN